MAALRILFMGTPDFAAASLQKLHEAGYSIVGVVTAPDKPAGRGRQLQESAVKQYALSQNLLVLQPVNLKDPDFIDTLKNLQPDLGVVVAFRMLPEAVWQLPAKGTFNLHASLLPKYRGAAPINWAIIQGETETGITTFFLKHAIDTGDLLFQEKVPIAEEDNFGSLYEKLKVAGAEMALKTTKAIEQGSYQAIPQQEEVEMMPAPKIFKETGLILWDQPARAIHNLVRGLAPVPAAYTHYRQKTYKILKTKLADLAEKDALPGDWRMVDKKDLFIRCKDGWLQVFQLQPEGKKLMHADEFLRGFQTQA